LEAANAGFAVGNSKLVIACNDPPRLQRWDLASGGLEKQRELLVSPSSSILRIGMGACSEGPIWLLIRRRRTDDAWYLYFGDLDSLEVVEAQSAESGNARVYSRSKLPSMQVSPDGSTLLTWLVSESSRYRDKLYVNRYERTASGVQVQEAFLDRAEPILSRDGRHVFMRSAVFDASLHSLDCARGLRTQLGEAGGDGRGAQRRAFLAIPLGWWVFSCNRRIMPPGWTAPS
jgi:hypothetical protein